MSWHLVLRTQLLSDEYDARQISVLPQEVLSGRRPIDRDFRTRTTLPNDALRHHLKPATDSMTHLGSTWESFLESTLSKDRNRKRRLDDALAAATECPVENLELVVREIETSLSSKNREIRAAACKVLGRLDSPLATQGLLKVVERDRAKSVSTSAREAIQQMGTDCVSELVDGWIAAGDRCRDLLRNKLLTFGTRTTAPLLKRLGAATNCSAENRILELLGEIGDESAGPQLERLYFDCQHDNRDSILLAIVETGSPNIEGVFQHAATNCDPKCRYIAIKNILRFSLEWAEREIYVASFDPEDSVRRIAAEIALSASTTLQHKLSRLKFDPAPCVRESAEKLQSLKTESPVNVESESMPRVLDRIDVDRSHTVVIDLRNCSLPSRSLSLYFLPQQKYNTESTNGCVPRLPVVPLGLRYREMGSLVSGPSTYGCILPPSSLNEIRFTDDAFDGNALFIQPLSVEYAERSNELEIQVKHYDGMSLRIAGEGFERSASSVSWRPVFLILPTEFCDDGHFVKPNFVAEGKRSKVRMFSYVNPAMLARFMISPSNSKDEIAAVFGSRLKPGRLGSVQMKMMRESLSERTADLKRLNQMLSSFLR